MIHRSTLECENALVRQNSLRLPPSAIWSHSASAASSSEGWEAIQARKRSRGVGRERQRSLGTLGVLETRAGACEEARAGERVSRPVAASVLRATRVKAEPGSGLGSLVADAAAPRGLRDAAAGSSYRGDLGFTTQMAQESAES